VRRRVPLLVALAAAVLAVAGPAGASVRLTSVDTSSFPTIRATVVSSVGPGTVPKLTEDGSTVVGYKARNLGHAKAVVLAVDVSRSMKGKPLSNAIAAARGFVASKPSADAISIVQFGPHAVALSGLSTATIDADAALRNLNVARANGTALYDAIVLAAKKLGASPLAGRVLIVLTDGRDVSSTATLDAAIAAAHNADVSIYPIGLEGAGFDPSTLERLARETGGTYHGTASTTALGSVYRSIAKQLGKTWQLSYVTAARPGDRLRLAVSAAGAGSAATNVVLPALPGDVKAAPAPSPLLPTAAYGGGGPVAIGLLTGMLVIAAVLLLIGSRRGSWLRSRLAAHTGSQVRSRRRRREQRVAALSTLFRSTERAFGHLRQWKAVQNMLDRGETPLRAAEFFYIVAACGIGVGLFAAVAGMPSLLIIIAMGVGALIPFGFVWRRMRKRLDAFETQLPDLLITIAASLKAGHSFKQGLQAIVDEGQPPASDEFKRVLTETGLGRPLDDALGEMSDRVSSKNFEFAITAVTIQRQVGGSLASLFDMVADTVRQRQQFARKIRSLTAMGRMSAYTLVGLPFFIAGAISVLNPRYLSPLLHTSTGHMLLFVGLAMMATGAAILKKIVSFKG
jgi:tight adherence protein B